MERGTMGQDHRLETHGFAVPDFLAAYWRSFGSSAQAAEPVLKSAARCNFELLSLTGRRARAYLELPATLSRCRSPQDLAAEQVRFWQTAAQQYAESGRGFMQAWNAMLTAGLKSSAGVDAVERDYITFAEPRQDEAAAQARKPGSRRAA
jgi:hypothetical protein